MDTSALEELMKALTKLFGGEEEGEETEEDAKDKPKGKTLTVISVGKGKPMPKGLKIPKAKKEMEEDAED